MSYSPEHLARQRALLRRRRGIAAAALTLLLCAVGAGVYLLNRNHHNVVVIRVATANVRAALSSTQHKHASTAPTPGGSSSSLLPPGATASFQRLAASLPGRIELAVTPLGAGAREVLGGDEAAHGWSTTKVPVLVALLRTRGAAGLTSQEQSWAQSAITESNNESVLALFGDLERLKGGLDGASEYIESLLRASGDHNTVVATAPPPAGAVTTFGQTEWAPGEAVKFFRALALRCLLPSSQTSYVLNLMQNIEPSESWGLGSAGFRTIAFKGGWGPEGGDGSYLVRQSGIIDPGTSKGAVVAIVAFAPSFGAGTEMLTATATWLNHHLALKPRPSTGCTTAE